jgi:predicted TIM-barrel fold metal-dependent hydrolase
MKAIDSHIHFFGDHADCIEQLDEMNLMLLNVCVAHAPVSWHDQREGYQKLAQSYPHRYAWCTSFDPPDFSDPDYVDRTVEQLQRDFKAGAVACKFWKNIGMEIRKPEGDFLMIDDPFFDPIYEYLVKSDRPALMHIGEPLACWQPLDEQSPHFSYYSQHPEWHMYGRPDRPSHAQLMNARDCVLERYPKLRVVGAHLGSLEHDVAEVARRLDRYLNFTVDTSARILDLVSQDPEEVRKFFLRYQDRILFGTDIVVRKPLSSMTAEQRTEALQDLKSTYELALSFFQSKERFVYQNREILGLGLARAVVEKLMLKNAASCYPIRI